MKPGHKPCEELFSAGKGSCWVSHLPSNLDLPLKRALRKPKAHLCILNARRESSLLSLQIWESSHGKKGEFWLKGTFRGYFIQPLKAEATSKFGSGCSGVLPSQGLSNSMNIHYTVSPYPCSRLAIPTAQICFTWNWNFICCDLCLKQLKKAITSPPA